MLSKTGIPFMSILEILYTGFRLMIHISGCILHVLLSIEGLNFWDETSFNGLYL